MPSTTTKGVPYSVGGDAASTIDTTMQSLAEWLDARPGIAPLTTVARDALSGATRWTGRIIWNTTTQRLEAWNGVSWVPVSAGPPVLTTTQRNLLTPATGDIIFNSTTVTIQFYNGTAWKSVSEDELAALTATTGGLTSLTGSHTWSIASLTATVGTHTTDISTLTGTIAAVSAARVINSNDIATINLNLGTRKITDSASSPSGGNNGDIWFKV